MPAPSTNSARAKLVDLVALMGNYASTAALLTAFAMRLDEGQPPPLPRLFFPGR